LRRISRFPVPLMMTMNLLQVLQEQWKEASKAMCFSDLFEPIGGIGLRAQWTKALT
jgi:hypothetical protein